jgi:predicted TIM-barrel fold metal-dependent hydrolase
MESQLNSYVMEGVFERFPDLPLVMIEGGFAWLPSYMWRADRWWRRLHAEVPHLQRPPSEYVRRNVYFTTQPMEEPHQKHHFHQLLEHLDMDEHILFSTDYPHWDFDSPEQAFPVRLPAELRRRILSDNARALYGF